MLGASGSSARSVSNETYTLVAGPSVQWPAVSTTVGEIRVPEQRNLPAVHTEYNNGPPWASPQPVRRPAGDRVLDPPGSGRRACRVRPDGPCQGQEGGRPVGVHGAVGDLRRLRSHHGRGRPVGRRRCIGVGPGGSVTDRPPGSAAA